MDSEFRFSITCDENAIQPQRTSVVNQSAERRENKNGVRFLKQCNKCSRTQRLERFVSSKPLTTDTQSVQLIKGIGQTSADRHPNIQFMSTLQRFT